MHLSILELVGIVLMSGLIAIFLYRSSSVLSLFKKTSAEKEPEVYMVINLRPLDPVKQKAYQDIAIPLAEKAGMEFLAASEPVVLGGDWPYEGLVVIERFRSMKAVKEYWHSEEYQKARGLLVGADLRDFTIIVEAD